MRECRAGRRLKLSCRNWGQFGGGNRGGSDRSARGERGRGQRSSDGNKGGFVQKLPEMEMGAELNRRKEGREARWRRRGSGCTDSCLFGRERVIYLVVRSWMDLKASLSPERVPSRRELRKRERDNARGEEERRRIYEPRSRGVKRPERSFRDLKQTRVKPRRRRVRRD